jgi:DNA-binding MarR family transcriptional regulator
MHCDLSVSMGFALKRLQQTLRVRMDAALAPYGLTTPQYLVLALLAEEPGMSNSELARRSAVAAPTMLRILDALSQAGHISRADRSPERRARGTTLTPSGEQRLASAAGRVQRFEDLLVAQAAPEHADIIMTWLRACTEQLSIPVVRPGSPS